MNNKYYKKYCINYSSETLEKSYKNNQSDINNQNDYSSDKDKNLCYNDYSIDYDKNRNYTYKNKYCKYKKKYILLKGGSSNLLETSQEKFLRKVKDDILKEFEHWYAILDIKQYYLGRMFLYAKRQDATDLTVLNDDEIKELFEIIRNIKTIYKKTFQPDKLNFAFLGNDEEHCHMHIVPRYKDEKTITIADETQIFKDDNYGHNYSRQNARDFSISSEIHNQIKKILKDEFKKI